MKVQIKDLEPNPFRDMENYPIDEEKVKALSNSINQTGFWDNILARQGGEKIQIAYGHHRLIVLQKEFKPTDIIDIPVRDLDNSTMIQVMANENHESWGMRPQIIDETVRVAKEYLEKNPEELKKLGQIKKSSSKDGEFEMGEIIISRFLGKNWKESKVRYSLERLGLIEKKKLDKKAVDILPTERSARNLVRAIKQVKNVTPEQQRLAAERMAKEGNLGESAAVKAVLEEKYRKEPAQKKEKLFEEFIKECQVDIKKLNTKINTILQYKKEFDSDYYRKTSERLHFISSAFQLMIGLSDLLGGKQIEKRNYKALIHSNHQE